MSELSAMLYRSSLDDDLRAYTETADEVRTLRSAGCDASAAEDERRQAAVDFMESLVAVLTSGTSAAKAASAVADRPQ